VCVKFAMSSNNTRRHCMVVFNQYPLGETRVQREAEALLQAGYTVDVICKRVPGEPAVDSYRGVGIQRVKFHLPIPLIGKGGLGQRFFDYLRFFITAFVKLNQLHGKQPYCSIQVHNLPDFLVFCTVTQKLRGVPVILDLHDLMPEFFSGRFGATHSLPAKLLRWQEQLSCRFAKHVITVSEHWRQALLQRGMPADKCSVLMNVADERIFHPVEGLPAQAPGRDGFRLIYHGGMWQRYGIDLLVQAVEQLQGEIPGVHLTLIGQGDILPDIRRMIEQKNLQDLVTIAPKCLAEELPAIILSCDLALVPYRADVFTDSLLPTKLMEYAALGMPAAASRTAAIEAYFSDANCEFFTPGNAEDLARCILSLYQHPERRTELARGSRKFNQRYNWAELSTGYVSLVDRLVTYAAPAHEHRKSRKVESSPG
jgi:glycosyltransferase involved in cell wall biosynthesis